MKLALDTNRYSDLMRGDSEVRLRVELADAVLLPFAVVAELKFGFLKGRFRQRNEGQLDAFVRQPGISILYPDTGTLHHHAAIRMQLASQGTPIPMNDVWIAAIVVQHGLSLCSRDPHFDLLPQIPRV